MVTTPEPGQKVWTSSNPTIMSVDSMTGLVHALAAGTTTIYYTTATSTNELKVTVLPLLAPAPIVYAPPTTISWSKPSQASPVLAANQKIQWRVTPNTGEATIHPTTGAIKGKKPGTVLVNYRIIDSITGAVVEESIATILTIPDTPRVSMSEPYVDGASMPINVQDLNLSMAIMGENGTIVTFSNVRSEAPTIATAALVGPNPSGHVFLQVKKVSGGSSKIAFDYTDSNGKTGTMTLTFSFTP